jgi:SulP family sulfate permease
MHQVINLDTTGLDALESLHLLIQRRGGRLILAGLNEQPLSLVSRSHFNDALGAQNLAPDLQTALQRARVDTAADAWDGAAR